MMITQTKQQTFNHFHSHVIAEQYSALVEERDIVCCLLLFHMKHKNDLRILSNLSKNDEWWDKPSNLNHTNSEEINHYQITTKYPDPKIPSNIEEQSMQPLSSHGEAPAWTEIEHEHNRQDWVEQPK